MRGCHNRGELCVPTLAGREFKPKRVIRVNRCVSGNAVLLSVDLSMLLDALQRECNSNNYLYFTSNFKHYGLAFL